MKAIHRVAVYCGSSSGSDPAFQEAARDTAEAMIAN